MIEYPPAAITLEDWTRCAPWIEAALRYSHGTHGLMDVLADIEANRATLWPFERSCVVTQIAEYPRLKVLIFWLAGGNMIDLLGHEPGIAAWAALQGCSRIGVEGRKGWQREMMKLGYKPAFHSTYKEIAP